jgi:cytochrome c-type biogenesis protein CcmH
MTGRRRARRLARAIALLVGLFPAPLTAQADLEREARAIESMLIAPCCFSQQVSVHQSPAADEVRRDVRARLAARQTRQQILDAYVDQYGARILAEPPSSTLTFYLPPIIAFVGSAGLLVWFVRRFARRAPTPAPADAALDRAPQASASANAEQRLDDELRDLD